MNKKSFVSSMLLLLAALIWGFAFTAQSLCTDYIGPFTYGTVRFFIGGTVLLPMIPIYAKIEKKQADASDNNPSDRPKSLKKLFIGGILCGVFLCAASVLQQAGIETTTPGKAGFITALYVVLVPVFGIFLRKKTPLIVWISVCLAVPGLYLLCVSSGFSIAKGDLLILGSALLFAFHILIIDHFSPLVNSVALSCIQFYTGAVFSGVLMLIYEQPSINAIMQCLAPILYIGVFSTGVAYTLQVIMQKNTNPTVASLLLSFESVFSVIGGWLILGQTLTARELCGCILMFAAVILSQLPPDIFRVFRKKRDKI